MAKWSDWLPDVMPRVMGASIPLVEQEVRRAAQEFMRRTRVWIEWLEQETTRVGSFDYEFDVPQGATVVRVERATLDGQPFDVQSFRALSADWTRPGADAQALVSANRATFRIGPVGTGKALQAQVSLVPGERALGIPDELHAQHHQHIAHGALARLLVIPAQAWTNFDLASMHAAAFERAIHCVAADAWRGHTNNTPRARTRWC